MGLQGPFGGWQGLFFGQSGGSSPQSGSPNRSCRLFLPTPWIHHIAFCLGLSFLLRSLVANALPLAHLPPSPTTESNVRYEWKVKDDGFRRRWLSRSQGEIRGETIFYRRSSIVVLDERWLTHRQQMSRIFDEFQVVAI